MKNAEVLPVKCRSSRRIYCSMLVNVAVLLTGIAAGHAHASGHAAQVAVATEHELSTRAALQVLGRGGNAVDAAVAAALVSGVVGPASSGLGGGGFALVWMEKEHAARFLDFRECAPAALPATALEQRPLPDQKRGLLVGVPGEPAGLFELHRQLGRLPFAEVTTEAARLGNEGFRVGIHLARMALSANASSAKLTILHALGFDRPGFGVGAWVRSPVLGRTLLRFGELGPAALLEGDLANDWVTVAAGNGGVLSLADLRDYRPKYRAPLRFSYGRFDIITAPPPSAGGLLLAQTLGTFLPSDLAQHRLPADRIRLLADAYRASLVDRFRAIGDPDFVAVDLVALLKPEYLAKRRAAILNQAMRPPPVTLPREQGTSHISVVDAEGNAVALTTTVNNAFGSKLLGPTSGVILNDELDDFGPGNSPNQPRPLARPVSSMTPTIVLDGARVRWVLGGSGGMAISTNVTTVLIAMLVDGVAPERAVEQPRFTIVPSSGELELERQFPRSVVRSLIASGERVRRVPRGLSAVQVVARTDSTLHAVADPRKHGRGMVAAAAPSK